MINTNLLPIVWRLRSIRLRNHHLVRVFLLHYHMEWDKSARRRQRCNTTFTLDTNINLSIKAKLKTQSLLWSPTSKMPQVSDAYVLGTHLNHGSRPVMKLLSPLKNYESACIIPQMPLLLGVSSKPLVNALVIYLNDLFLYKKYCKWNII